MKRYCTRVLSFLLILAMLTAALAGLLTVQAANTAARHQVCTSLSAQAKSYYKGQYTYEMMSQLDGGSTSCLEAVNSPLYQSLHDLMESTMTKSVSYKSLTGYWEDTDNNIQIYSDCKPGGTVSREHVWPKSRASFYQSGGGSDLHHLRPEDSTVNSTRGNYTMGNVRGVISGYSTMNYQGKSVLYYSASRDLVEVNDNVKGDVARILLYVYVRWEEPNLFETDPDPRQVSGDTGGNNGLKVIENLDTLLQWCEMDPVDEWEMRRNDLCQDVQHNRNVFIDYPEYAWLLFGQPIPSDMTTPSGEAKNAEPTDPTDPIDPTDPTEPTYTVTAVSENTAYGTVTMRGDVITATPNPGYTVSGYRITPEGAATVTRSGDTFTVSNVRENCTVTITFEAQAAATITYVVPNGVTVNGITEANIGQTVPLASVSGRPAGEGTYLFYGWAEARIEDTIIPPVVQKAGESYTLTAAQKTFYAVFRYSNGLAWHYATEFGAPEHDCPCDDYSDLDKNEWYHEGVDMMLENGYMNGVGAGRFDPDGATTRAMIVTILWRMEGEPEPQADNPFTDVKANEWYTTAIAWAAENEVVNGVGYGRFEPDERITREQMATILYRYASYCGADTSARAALSGFPDGGKLSAWAEDAMRWAVAGQIINGSDGYLLPQGDATRAQVAAILYRSMALLSK